MEVPTVHILSVVWVNVLCMVLRVLTSIDVSVCVCLCSQAGGGAETASGRKVDPNGEIRSEEVQTLQIG